METSKFLFVLLIVSVVLIEAKPTRNDEHQRPQKHCSKVRGLPCVQDSECACLNRHNSTLICNYAKKCERLSFVDKIMRRQPCPGVFKSRCAVNEDCHCSEHKLICEDRECVKERVRLKQV